eukprot:2904356-Pyramimonas_sp.AAC.1
MRRHIGRHERNGAQVLELAGQEALVDWRAVQLEAVRGLLELSDDVLRALLDDAAKNAGGGVLGKAH